jgi:EF-P beta-lysylation protein EpmB
MYHLSSSQESHAKAMLTSYQAEVPCSPATSLPRTWQQELQQAIRDPRELCRHLGLPDALVPGAEEAGLGFPLFAPRPFVSRIEHGNPTDPLLRQLLPIADELAVKEGFTADPLSEQDNYPVPGLLQKYHGRALLVTTGACAIHCRYCFRREYPYHESPAAPRLWQPAIDQLAADPQIEEVILSGGDPLTLVDSQLSELVERLQAVPHLKLLRIHTRLPIMIPGRICDSLLDWLTGMRLQPIMVIHANHAHELDAEVAEALERLSRAGVMLLNQSVLLSGVNDDAGTLADLSRRLIELRVQPYYLHQLDRVQGAAHFEVPVERGQQILRQLSSMLPGYALPRYVRELPGQPAKTPIPALVP